MEPSKLEAQATSQAERQAQAQQTYLQGASFCALRTQSPPSGVECAARGWVATPEPLLPPPPGGKENGGPALKKGGAGWRGDEARALPDLVVAKDTVLSVYRVVAVNGDGLDNENTTATGASDGGAGGIGHERLDLVAEYKLWGSIESLVVARVTDKPRETAASSSSTPSSSSTSSVSESKPTRDSILLSFAEARVAVLGWSAESGALRVRSLHSFEKEAYRRGRTQFLCPPVLRVDPQQRCATLVVYDSFIAVIPLTAEATDIGGDEDEPILLDAALQIDGGDDRADIDLDAALGLGGTAAADSLDTSADAEGSTRFESGEPTGTNGKPAGRPTVPAPDVGSQSIELPDSFVVGLSRFGIRHVKSLEFLHGYFEPALAVLHEPRSSWAGRIHDPKCRDNAVLTVLSLTMSQQLTHVIWQVDMQSGHPLPYDSNMLVPVPEPVGGVLVLSTNALIHCNQASVTGISLNGYAASFGQRAYPIVGLVEGSESTTRIGAVDQTIPSQSIASDLSGLSGSIFDSTLLGGNGNNALDLQRAVDQQSERGVSERHVDHTQFFSHVSTTSSSTSHEFVLAGCRAVWLITPEEAAIATGAIRTSPRLLFVLRTGQLVMCDMFVESVRVAGFSMRSIGETSVPSVLVRLDTGLLFLGSSVGDSLLIRYLDPGSVSRGRASASSVSAGMNLAPSRKKARAMTDDMDEEDLLLFGDTEGVSQAVFEATSSSSSDVGSASWIFSVRDFLPTLAPINDVCVARARDLASQSRALPQYDVVTVTGRDARSSFVVAQQSVRPEILVNLDVENITNLWTLHLKSRTTLDQDNQFHRFVLMSHSDAVESPGSNRTTVLKSTDQLNNISSINGLKLSVKKTTVFAGNLGEHAYLLQVTKSHLFLLQDETTLLEDVDIRSTNVWKSSSAPDVKGVAKVQICRACIFDPYVVCLLTNGHVICFVLQTQKGSAHLVEVPVQINQTDSTAGGVTTAISLFADSELGPFGSRVRPLASTAHSSKRKLSPQTPAETAETIIFCTVVRANGRLEIYDIGRVGSESGVAHGIGVRPPVFAVYRLPHKREYWLHNPTEQQVNAGTTAGSTGQNTSASDNASSTHSAGFQNVIRESPDPIVVDIHVVQTRATMPTLSTFYVVYVLSTSECVIYRHFLGAPSQFVDVLNRLRKDSNDASVASRLDFLWKNRPLENGLRFRKVEHTVLTRTYLGRAKQKELLKLRQQNRLKRQQKRGGVDGSAARSVANDESAGAEITVPRAIVHLQHARVARSLLAANNEYLAQQKGPLARQRIVVVPLGPASNGAAPDGVSLLVCGERPAWIFFQRDFARVHSYHVDGPVVCCSPLRNENCPVGFIFATRSQLNIAQLPAQQFVGILAESNNVGDAYTPRNVANQTVAYDLALPYRRVFMHAGTVRSVCSHAPTGGLLCVVETKVPREMTEYAEPDFEVLPFVEKKLIPTYDVKCEIRLYETETFRHTDSLTKEEKVSGATVRKSSAKAHRDEFGDYIEEDDDDGFEDGGDEEETAAGPTATQIRTVAALQKDERVMCMECLTLQNHSGTGGRSVKKSVVVIGTAISAGEDELVRGRVLVVDVIKPVAMDFRMKLLATSIEKGPISAITSTDGYVVISCGNKLFQMNFTGDALHVVGFWDNELFATTLCSAKQFVCAGDLYHGCQLFFWKPLAREFKMLAKDYVHTRTAANGFVAQQITQQSAYLHDVHAQHNTQQLCVIAADVDGFVQTLVFDPKVFGRKLVLSAEFHAGVRISKMIGMLSRPVWPGDRVVSISKSGGDASSLPEEENEENDEDDEIANNAASAAAANQRKTGTSTQVIVRSRRRMQWWFGLGGSFGVILPLPPVIFKRLQELQDRLVVALEHTAGCNPREFRSSRAPRLDPAYQQRIGNPPHAMLDCDLLARYIYLELPEQRRVARQVGTTVETILDNLAELDFASLNF